MGIGGDVLERDASVGWVAAVVVVVVRVALGVARPTAVTASLLRSVTETWAIDASSSSVGRVRMRVSDGNH